MVGKRRNTCLWIRTDEPTRNFSRTLQGGVSQQGNILQKDGVVIHKKTPFSSLSPLLSFKAHLFLICFYYCLARGSTSVVELLLDNGSDVLLTDDQSYTSLHLSAAWESASTVNLLLAAVSDINALNRKTAADVVSQSPEVSLALHAIACQAP